MSPTAFKLGLAAVGMAAVLWSLPVQLADAGCNACAQRSDLPKVAPGATSARRIR
jgi:hypothetical protein